MVEQIFLPRAKTRRDLWADYGPFSLALALLPGARMSTLLRLIFHVTVPILLPPT